MIALAQRIADDNSVSMWSWGANEGDLPAADRTSLSKALRRNFVQYYRFRCKRRLRNIREQ